MHTMRSWFWISALTLSSLASPILAQGDTPKNKPKPQVEVVFCLDTTGSMGGLIEGAKAKIWSISNQIANGKPTPNLKLGLVAYRDRGDQYITRVFDLTDDLDAIHGHLKGFSAGGGGDGPESVNQALDDAVNKIKWSTDAKTLRIIFLVGDAPPHMDYTNDVKYPETCKKACEKGIIINTVQCGNDSETTRHWREICVKAEGQYAQIQQDGGVVAVATPLDKRLSEINKELASSTVVFGEAKEREKELRKVEDAKALAPAAAADRAGFAGKSGKTASFDLIDAIKEKKVNLNELKDDQLPEELRKMTLDQRKDHLKKLEEKRAALQKEAVDLDRQRSDFIQKKIAEGKTGGKDGFDNQVLEMLRKQAKKSEIDY